MSKKDPLKKQRNKQHRTNEDGEKLLKAALPNSKAFSMVFNEQLKNDYGIDGELQVFIDENYTGEVFKVQLKSTEGVQYIDKGRTVSFSLDLSSAYLLIEDMKTPAVLIVADVKVKKVFWCPIQTNEAIRNALNDKLSHEITAENPAITIHIDAGNVLAPDRYQDFYDYLKTANIKLSQKATLKAGKDQTLGAGMHYLDEIEQGMINLEGFDARYRNESDPAPQGVMFSVMHSTGKVLDYIPSKDYRPEHAPKVKMRTKFSTKLKSDKLKYEAFRRVVEDGEGSVELDNGNIDFLEATSGGKVLDKTGPDKGFRVSIGPSLEKVRQTFLINNETEELSNVVELWFEAGAFRLASIKGQALSIAAVFQPDRLKTTFKLHINNDQLTDAAHELHLMEFVRAMKKVEIGFIDPQGFRRKLFGGTVDGKSIVPDENHRFVKALSEIEEKTGVPIPYPLPEKLIREEVYEAYWLHRLLTEGKVTKDMTMRFKLANKPPEEPIKGGALSMSQSPPEIYLFKKPYVMPGFKHTITGVVSETEKDHAKGKNAYKVRLKDAEITIEKDSNPALPESE